MKKKTQNQINDIEGSVTTSFEFLLKLRLKPLDLHKISRRAPGFQSGNHASRFRGRGVDFEEVRLYQPGDDIRYIDWRVTARHNRPYTKIFNEERNRPVFILLDQRCSLFFGSQRKMKSVLAAELACILAGSVLKSRDRLGAVLFNDETLFELRPQTGTRNFQSFCKEVASFNQQLLEKKGMPPQLDMIEKAFDALTRVVKPGSLVFIISDFYHCTEQVFKNLSTLAQHNEIMGFRVYDTLEEQLPIRNLAYSNGTQRITLGINDRALLTNYAERAKKINGILESNLFQKKIPLFHFSTAEDPFLSLESLFKKSSKGISHYGQT